MTLEYHARADNRAAKKSDREFPVHAEKPELEFNRVRHEEMKEKTEKPFSKFENKNGI